MWCDGIERQTVLSVLFVRVFVVYFIKGIHVLSGDSNDLEKMETCTQENEVQAVY